MPRNLKKGGGRSLKPFVFRPKSSEEQKKNHHTVRMSFIRISPLHHESFLHLSAGEARPPLGLGQAFRLISGDVVNAISLRSAGCCAVAELQVRLALFGSCRVLVGLMLG